MILKYEQGGWLPFFPCCSLWSKQIPQAAGKESNGFSSLVNLLFSTLPPYLWFDQQAGLTAAWSNNP